MTVAAKVVETERTFSERGAAEYLEINVGTLRVYRFRSRITPATTAEQTGVVTYTQGELDRFSRKWLKTIRLNAVRVGWGTTRTTNLGKKAIQAAVPAN